MSADGQFPGQLSAAKNFDASRAAISETRALELCGVNSRAIFETIEQLQVHRQITNGVTGVIEAAFGNAADERHLAAFEANPDRAAGAGGLALAAAPAGFAVAAGFALAKPLAAVLGSGTRFEIVQTHVLLVN